MKRLVTLTYLCLVLLLQCSAYAAEPNRVLIVVGPTNHPPGTHEVAAGGRLMKYCLENMDNLPGVKADVALTWPDKALRDSASSIVFIGDTFPPNRLPNAAQNLVDLDEMMRRGCGIVCVHYATGLLGEDVKPDGDHPLLGWMGGYFANRSCPHHESFAKIFPAAVIQPSASEHPIWRGGKEFTINDEPYTNNYFGNKNNQPGANVTVLATSMLPPESPKRETISWCIERADSGRGFAIVMPHFYRNWKNDELRRYILNGIVWSAKLAVPAQGVQTKLPDLNSFQPAALEPLPPAPKGKPTTAPDSKTQTDSKKQPVAKSSIKIDLSHWKLTLPIAAAESRSKPGQRPMEISADQLSAGYSHPDYFHRAPEGGLEFWCPVDGVTTENTSYPRTELRELLDPHDDNVCWLATGTHTLNATCRVVQVPSSQKVIIGQIHSHSGAAKPLIKLQYFKGRIEALVKEHPSNDSESSGKEIKLSLPEVGLNHEFDYEIQLSEGLLSVTVLGQTESVNIFERDPQWATQSLYFKAGVYVQDNSGPGTEGARAVFSSIRCDHAPEAARR